MRYIFQQGSIDLIFIDNMKFGTLMHVLLNKYSMIDMAILVFLKSFDFEFVCFIYIEKKFSRDHFFEHQSCWNQ